MKVSIISFAYSNKINNINLINKQKYYIHNKSYCMLTTYNNKEFVAGLFNFTLYAYTCTIILQHHRVMTEAKAALSVLNVCPL